jgi:hypothetical protein
MPGGSKASRSSELLSVESRDPLAKARFARNFGTANYGKAHCRFCLKMVKSFAERYLSLKTVLTI